MDGPRLKNTSQTEGHRAKRPNSATKENSDPNPWNLDRQEDEKS
jgi:hypothetical protein